MNLSPTLISAACASQPAEQTHDSLWIALLGQVGALLVFGLGIYFSSRARTKQAAADRQKDRETRQLDMKREVLLEVAPALVKSFASLAKLINPNTAYEKIAKDFSAAARPMAKIQACGGTRTVDAAAKLMTEVGVIFARLSQSRLLMANNFAAVTALAEEWAREITAIPALYAGFMVEARAELGLDLDREAFEEGMRASFERQKATLDAMLDALSASLRGGPPAHDNS